MGLLGTIAKSVLRIFGSRNERAVRALLPIVQKINALEPSFRALGDEELRAKTGEFRARLVAGKSLDDLLPEAFAAVRETSRRYSVATRPRLHPLASCMLLSGSRSYAISVRRIVPRVASIQNRPLAGTSSPRGSWMIVGRAFSSKATSTAGNPAIVRVPFRLKARSRRAVPIRCGFVMPRGMTS